MRRLLASTLPQVVVASRDLPAMIAEADAITAETCSPRWRRCRRGEKARAPGLSTAYAEPRDERERQLAALWEELFGIAPIGIERQLPRAGRPLAAGDPDGDPDPRPASRPTCR